MAYRNKVYVAFDADSDIHYYRLMQAWKQNDYTSFDFDNAHDYFAIRSWSSEETIKENLRQRFQNTQLFILLVGKNTKYLYKYVRWEIEQAIKRGIPIIVVNLNGKRSMDSDLCPLIIKDELAIHISFNQKIIEYAMENWPDRYTKLKTELESGPYYYRDSIYTSLNL